MDNLQQTYFNNTLEEWITAIGISLVVFGVLWLVLKFAANRFGKIAARTETKIDDLIIDLLRSTRWYVLLVWSASIGMQWLNATPGILSVVPSIIVLFSLLQIGIWGNRVIGYWIGRIIEDKLGDDATTATTMAGVRFIARLVLYAVIVLLALDNIGVDVTAAVASLGVGGIAVALALQNILGDLFASLSIILDKPFQIGDFIVVGDFVGTVEHIGLKTTRMRSLSGEQIVLSNSDLLGSRIRNFKRMAERRIVFSIGVTYQTSAETLKAIPGILKDVITKHKKVRFDRAHFKAFADSALTFEAVYIVLSSDYAEYMNIQQDVNLDIFERFSKEGIDFAYPTRTLFVSQEGPKDA